MWRREECKSVQSLPTLSEVAPFTVTYEGRITKENFSSKGYVQGGQKKQATLSFVNFLSVFAHFFQKIILIPLGGCGIKMKVITKRLLKIG